MSFTVENRFRICIFVQRAYEVITGRIKKMLFRTVGLARPDNNNDRL